MKLFSSEVLCTCITWVCIRYPDEVTLYILGITVHLPRNSLPGLVPLQRLIDPGTRASEILYRRWVTIVLGSYMQAFAFGR